jgi:hypothetical protein
MIDIDEQEPELCEFCNDTVDDCIDAGECNFGIIDNCIMCNGVCLCDSLYEQYKEDQADAYFKSKDD